METTSTIFKQSKSISLNPPVRITLAILSVLASLWCAFNAVIIAIVTVAISPALVIFSATHLFGALLGFVTYVGSALIYATLTAISVIFAHHLFKKQPISRRTIIAAVSLIALAIIFQFVLLPLFGSTFMA